MPAMVSIIQLITILAAPFIVLACEGECISGTTKEFLKLYSSPIHHVLQDMAEKVAAECVPPDDRRQNAMSYMTPIFNAYKKVCYDGLEHAIFPSYFHGKCLDSDGSVPEGCPNPDCPVVCGTPGSMVHFFPTLSRIAFDYISTQLTNITHPESKAYKQVEKMILADPPKSRRGAFSRAPRSAKLQAQRTAIAEKRLRSIMKGFPRRMLKACGGWNLSKCSWETRMKKFILQYP